MEDKKISDAVELLLKGAKMLAHHCPECSMPLFLHEGKVICPSCRKEMEIVEKGDEVTVKLKEEKEKVEKRVKEEFDIEEEMKEVLRIYIKRLASDFDSAEETIRTIEGILSIIEKIRKLNIR